MNLILEAKRPGYADWQCRSRLTDINYELRDGKISLERAFEKIIAMRVAWMGIEPHTEFRVTTTPK
jgi:hypothetical protein